MRKTAFILLLTGLALTSEAGVIAYWRFEDVEKYVGAGRLVSYDTSETWGIVNPTLYDDVPTTVIPATGESNAHSTGGGYIGREFGGAEIILESQFTVECYYRLDHIQMFASLFAFGGRFQTYGLGFGFLNDPWSGDEEGTVRFGASFNDSGSYWSDPMDFVFGEWFHFAMVKNDDWCGFYINGNLWWYIEDELDDYYAWGNWMDDIMNIGGYGYMDEFRISDVALSPNQFLNYAAIPEPSTFALLALGGGFLAWRKRKIAR